MKYEKLSKLRKKKGLSMAQISKELNISSAYYCQLENKKKRLSYEMAVKIASIFDTKPDDIFYNE